jgi:hypothetical protein
VHSCEVSSVLIRVFCCCCSWLSGRPNRCRELFVDGDGGEQAADYVPCVVNGWTTCECAEGEVSD